MSTTARQVSWRLTVDGDDIAIQKLEAVGRKARKAVEPVPNALKAVSAASEDFQEKLSDLSGKTGTVGRALSAMGPVGLGVAATLGTLALAAHEAFSQTREAQEFADRIESVAQRLRLTTDAYQELTAAGRVYNLTQDQVIAGLDSLRQSVSQFIAGTLGKGGSHIFSVLGLTRQDLAAAGDFEGQIRLIADSLARIQNQSVREGLAQKLGVSDLLPMLQGGAEALDDLRRKAHDAGQVMASDVVKAGADANREYEELSNKVGNKLKTAFIGLSPIVLGAKRLFADFASTLADIVQSLTKIEDRSTDALKKQYHDALVQVEMLSQLHEKSPDNGIVEHQLIAAKAELARLNAEFDRRFPLTGIPKKSGGAAGSVNLPPSLEDERAAAQAQREADIRAQRLQALSERRVAFIDQMEIAEQRARGDRINADNSANVELLRNREGYYKALLKQADDARDAEIALIQSQAQAQIDQLNKIRDAYHALNQEMPDYQGALASIQRGADEAIAAANGRNQQDRVQITREAAGALSQLADTLSGPLDRALKEVGANELNRFTDTLAGVVTGAQDAGSAVTSMVDSIISDLARLVIEREITKPLAGALDTAIGSYFGGGHASGGGTRGNITYRVNEQGGMPESWFNAQGDGYILSSASSLSNVVNLVRRQLPPSVVAMSPVQPPRVEVNNYGEPLDVASQSHDPATNTTRIDLRKQATAAGTSDIRNGAYDGAFSDRFGVRPAARRRQ